MPSNDEQDLPSDPTPTLAGHAPGDSRSDGPPTFPSEAESLLKHLKFGRSDPPSPPAPPGTASGGAGDRFPHIPGYEIECEIGRGGMGVVYKARHAALRHTVAIKMILASAHAAPGELARFMAEAEAIAAVKHPNVVQVFDLGVAAAPGPDAGRPFFVMEYVGGGNLAGHLKSGGVLAPDGAAELIEVVALGVQAAHDAGIVHRDLKPANILLSAERKAEPKPEVPGSSASNSALRGPRSALAPKVSDFGLAKRLSSDMTRSQAVMGTPAYMAPEQAGGKAKFVGPPADVYALGVILYECLTGAVPFSDPDPWSLIRQVLDDAPEAPSKRAPHVPRDLELICLKCLEKEPHHRYTTAQELADDLRRFLNRETVSVRPIGAPTRLARWARKRPAAAALAAVGVLLLVTVPALAVGVQERLNRRADVAAEAQKKEEAARWGEEAANRARVAAEQLGEARELFAIQNKLRNRASARPLGWPAANLGELPRAVALARGDSAVLEDLRSAAATALLADGLAPAEPVAKGINASVVAADPKSGLIAVGEHKAWGDCRVLLVDAATGRTVRQLSYATVAVKGPGGTLDVVQDGCRALAFNPAGTRLFVGTRSSRVVQFNLASDPPVPPLVWNVSAAPVDQLAVSHDGTTVYGICRSDPKVFAWNPETGEPRQSLIPPDGDRVYGITAPPVGGLLAAGSDRLHQWDAGGALVRSVPAPGAGRVAVGPGSVVLVGAGSRLEVHDRHTLEPTDAFTDPTLRRGAHEEGLRSIAVHPSGAYAATAAGDTERTVKVWELASGRRLAVVRASGTGPIAVAWSGDGGHLLATAYKRVERWRFAPAGAQRFACGGASAVEAAALLGDGRVAALGELTGPRRELLVGRCGETAALFEVTEGGGSGWPGVSADPTGTLAVTLTTNGLLTWKPGPPFPPMKYTKSALRLPRYSRDGGILWAVFDAKQVRAIDTKTGAARGTWNNGIVDVFTGLGSLEALGAGRDLAAAGGRDGSVYLLSAKCELSTIFRGPGDAVLAVALAPDDSLIAVGTQGGSLRLIRTADKTELPAVPAHPGGVAAVAISRGGALLATGGRDQSVRLWKRSGDRFEPLLAVADLPAAVRELQFSPTDGRLLVLLDHEHAVRVWDVDRLRTQLAEQKLGW